MTAAVHQRSSRAPRWRWLGSVETLVVVLGLALLLRGWVVDAADSPAALATAAVFVSVTLQALPFLLLGVLLREAIDAFLVLAVAPELANEVQRHDVAAAVLNSSALSPVVLTATAVAFTGHPGMVFARLFAGVGVAALVALLLRRLGQPVPRWTPGPIEVPAFVDRCREGVIRGGGVLVGGAAVVALLGAGLPVRWLDILAAYPVVAITAAALFAVLVSRRAEVDPLLMSALGQFSLTARLVFLVVGPVVNLRTFSVQSAAIGPTVALRYHAIAFALSIVVATMVGVVLL